MEEFLPHPPPAALRVRAGQPRQGRGAQCRRRHHRPRHGQSGPAGTGARHREAQGDDRQASHRPLFRPPAAFPGLRRAQAAYYERRFGVKLNPETQVVATLGSKEGFANVAQAITAPGDVMLVPNPSYPIHAFGFLMAGGVIRSVPSEPDARFLPGARARDHAFDPEAARGGGLLSVQSDRLRGRARFLQGPCRRSRRSTIYRAVRSRLCGGLFRRQSAALACCRCRARWTSPSSSRRCPRPSPCRAGAWALRSATSASSRRSRG